MTAGALIPNLLVTASRTNFVAVVVSAITPTPVGIRLLTSPTWLNAVLKVSPLYKEAKGVPGIEPMNNSYSSVLATS